MVKKAQKIYQEQFIPTIKYRNLGLENTSLFTGGLAIPYNKKLKANSRYLRNHGTPPEILLWKKIRKDALGYRFNRQKPLLNYIVDFYCPTLKIVIEVDGSSHDSPENRKYDKIRQKHIEEYGVTFLRFKNEEVLNDMQAVLKSIRLKIKERKYSQELRPQNRVEIPLTPFKKGGK